MRTAKVFMNGIETGILEELVKSNYRFTYHEYYNKAPISLTMPVIKKVYEVNKINLNEL